MTQHQTPAVQKRVVHRLKIARGHLDKVITMAENQDYCIDIIHQSQAVQAALKQIDTLLLDNHLTSCVIPQIKNGKTDVTKEILEVFKKK